LPVITTRTRAALVALALSLVAVVATTAPAGAATTPTASAPSLGQTVDQVAAKALESRAVQWLADQVALTQIQLSPWAKRTVNRLIAVSTPLICPLLGKAAKPGYEAFLTSTCLSFGQAPDPWEKIKSFVPLLCSFGGLIFKWDYIHILILGCQFLK
jgi:hypothetical protein